MADPVIRCETNGCPNHCKPNRNICGACTRCATCGMTEDPLTTVNGRKYCEKCVPIICTTDGCKKMRKPTADYCKACRFRCATCNKLSYKEGYYFVGQYNCEDCRVLCDTCGAPMWDWVCGKCL